MYSNVNIILLILLYQCLTIYSFRYYMGKYRRGYTTIRPEDKDCNLWVHDKLVPRIALAIKTKTHKELKKDINGRIRVKNNKLFKLACTPAKFMLDEIIDLSEIIVRCVNDDLLWYNGRKYPYKEFLCDGPPDPKQVLAKFTAAKEIQIIPKQLLDPGAMGCFYLLPFKDYTFPVPFVGNGSHAQIIRVGKSGLVYVDEDTTFHLACPGSKFRIPEYVNGSLVTGRCLNQTYFEYNGEVVSFHQFRCEKMPSHSLQRTQETCQEIDYDILDVGFKTKYSFLASYKICFDRKYKNAIYAWYFIQGPTYKHFQDRKKRPNFIQTKDAFGNIDVFTTYAQQTKTLEKVISSNALANWYIKQHEGIRYITHGQLVTTSDFVYAFEQDTTFYYENTTPMWCIFNKGIWRDLERLFRKTLGRSTDKHMIMTGTFGQSELPDMDLKQHKLFLSWPDKMSVPLFIWKLDWNLNTEVGVVYIGMNNPYKTIDKSVYICNFIPCPGRLTRKSYSKELLYCCTKDSFEETFGRIDPIVYREF